MVATDTRPFLDTHPSRPLGTENETLISAGAVDEAGSGARQDCLDRAGEKYGYTRGDVASVRLMLRLLPVFGLMMSYFTVYSHMASVFVLQVRSELITDIRHVFTLLTCFGCCCEYLNMTVCLEVTMPAPRLPLLGPLRPLSTHVLA